MARSTTTNLGLGVWDDGDSPGAGSKTTASGNTGLNANPLILDAAVGAEHNADGTHKHDTINGAQLKNSVADGSTIETSASSGTKTLRVKDGGISTAKLADGAITTAKLADSGVTSSKVADSGITTSKVSDGAITAAKLADSAAVKLSGDQSVGGKKTFTTNPVIDPGTTTSELLFTSTGDEDGQSKIGDHNFSDYHAARLMINVGTVEDPDWKDVLWAASNDTKVLFPGRDLYANGKKMATLDDVLTRVRSGYYTLETSMTKTISGAGDINFTDHGSGIKRFIVPENSRLLRVSFAQVDETHDYSIMTHWDTTYDFTGIDIDPTGTTRMIRPALTLSNAESGYTATLKLYAEYFAIGEPESTEIFSEELTQIVQAADQAFYLTLLFSV